MRAQAVLHGVLLSPCTGAFRPISVKGRVYKLSSNTVAMLEKLSTTKPILSKQVYMYKL